MSHLAVGDPILLETTPGLLVGSATETADSTTFTTATEIGSVTASLVDGVVYEVECIAQVSSSVDGDNVLLLLREDSTTGTVMLASAEERAKAARTGLLVSRANTAPPRLQSRPRCRQ